MKIRDVGISVHNVTHDGTSTNISALQNLGCKLAFEIFFNVEGVNLNICVMLDVVSCKTLVETL